MEKIVVVGLGLIGGSIVKGLKDKSFDIYGIDHDEKVMQTCYQLDLIKNETADMKHLKEADVIFICLYPEAAVEFLRINQASLKTGVVLTDVIGLKESVMTEINTFIRPDICFIGGHPMAGKEGQGFKVSDEKIFNQSNYLLVINEKTPFTSVDKLKNIILSLGCKHVEILDAKKHDEIIAYTSHMPHILSTVFMNCDRFTNTKNCVAGSFRDMTRVSNINASLWSELIIENKMPVLKEIKLFKMTLESIEDMIIENNINEIVRFLENAKEKKLSLGIL